MEESTQKNFNDPKYKLQKKKSQLSFPEHGKLPPQAIDFEEAVLGALMLEKDALTAVLDILKPEVFYKEAHKTIFEAIISLFSKTEPIDILTVTNELKSRGDLEIIGGPYYITQLTNRIASAANIEYHARILAQKFIQRELIKISSNIIKDAYEETTDVLDLLDQAEQDLFSVSESNLRRNYVDMHSLVKEAIEQIENIKNKEGQLNGLPSGFTEIDRVTAGWQRSDLIILASRPGMGKTAFALSIARNIAVELNKHAVAIFSLEMSALQLVTRLIASESGIDSQKLKRGNLSDADWQHLHTRINKLSESNIFIDDTPALTVFELRAKSRRLKAQHNIEFIILDYLQLMSGGGDNRGNREQEISNISRSLKSLAKELDIPIMALSQLSRAVETRGGSKKPVLSDLRESGAIEQDADMVMFIYRPEYYKIDEDEQGHSTAGLAEISIAKHRNGALADIPLRFIPKYAKFTDLDTDVYSPLMEAGEMKTMTRPSKMNNENEEEPF